MKAYFIGHRKREAARILSTTKLSRAEKKVEMAEWGYEYSPRQWRKFKRWLRYRYG